MYDVKPLLSQTLSTLENLVPQNTEANKWVRVLISPLLPALLRNLSPGATN